MKRVIVGIALCVAVGAPSLTLAQSCSASGGPGSCNVPATVSMTAGRVVRLQMSAGSTPLAAPTTADFDAGFNSTTGPSLTMSANAPWTLYIRAGSSVWSATNTSPGAPARVNKPAADLKWSTAAAGSFAPLSITDASLATGTATASAATTLYFQTLYNWTVDSPGNYSLTVVLTLTAP